jgi:anaerobic selenocysteine-containing dehydrogenase
MTGSTATFVRTTCPRDCYDACGIVVVTPPGLRPRVRGDKEHPVSRGQLCQKCSIAYNGVFLDPDARILTPRRRIGAKGTGKFAAVSWDEAIEEASSRLEAIVADSGGATVLTAHYTGTFAMIGYFFPLRFFNRLGATEVDPDTICNNAGHVALRYLYGTSLDGFDPRTARDATAIMVWGANPSASAPHQHEHWLTEAPGRVIVVDPVKTETAKAADLHLQLFPGSDAALAFALAHVLDRDGLIDHEFVASHTIGFEEIEPDIRRCSPVWAEQVTGVPAALIEEAAHFYGEGPSLLWIGQGLQRQPMGGNVVRAVGLLPALTANVGRPGTGFLYLNGIETRGLDGAYLTAQHLAGSSPPAISHMDLVAALEDRNRSRALVCWNINIAASNPQQRRLQQALSRDDLFTVAVDLFPTDTTDYADLVLPAASFLEQNDLVVSYFHQSLSAQVKAVDPPGAALSNADIFRRLAAGMGYEDRELFESDDEIIDRLLAQSGTGLDFPALAQRGTVWPSEQPRLQFAGLRFPTSSGRIEIASEAAARAGLPRTPRPIADPSPSGGRLRLISAASPWMLNTEYSNDPKIGRRIGPLTISLNPREAASRGLADGQPARVVSEVGELVVRVAISDDVPMSVALIPKGRWPKLEPTGANVNILNPGRKSDMGESSSVHGLEVTVEATP